MIGDGMYERYLSVNSPEERINYSYSTYEGNEFLKCYQEIRSEYLRLYEVSGECTIQDAELLMWLKKESCFQYYTWALKVINEEVMPAKLVLLIKRFEVTKRIYEEYNEEMRPVDKRKYHSVSSYIAFGYVLSISFNRLRYLPALNALLKVCDILVSSEKLEWDDEGRHLFCGLVRRELIAVDGLRDSLTKSEAE